ncbi:hypothetical protein BY996DRAFT_6533586 [Phakopsora pachyrhizi]|nr:hypothetical protein BY996DRAFT_6533586 [Phakopsora pachyrhizi]
MPKRFNKRQKLVYTIKEMELQSLLESDSDSDLETDILYLNHLLTKQYLIPYSTKKNNVAGPSLIDEVDGRLAILMGAGLLLTWTGLCSRSWRVSKIDITSYFDGGWVGLCSRRWRASKKDFASEINFTSNKGG